MGHAEVPLHPLALPHLNGDVGSVGQTRKFCVSVCLSVCHEQGGRQASQIRRWMQTNGKDTLHSQVGGPPRNATHQEVPARLVKGELALLATHHLLTPELLQINLESIGINGGIDMP